MKRTIVAAAIASICTLGHPLLSEAAGGRSFTRGGSSSGNRSSGNSGGSNSSRNNGGWGGRSNSSNNGGWQRNNSNGNNGNGGWNQPYYPNQNVDPNANGGWNQGGGQTNSLPQTTPAPSVNKLNVVPYVGSKPVNSFNQTVLKPVNPQPGAGNPKNVNGGNANIKIVFKIINGKLVRLSRSGDGNWAVYNPDGSADAPDYQPVAGDDPSAAITLLNPPETRGTVNFTLGSQNGSLDPGNAAESPAPAPQLIVFDRGGSFGEARYTVEPGAAYRFAATDQGWDLRTVSQ